MLIKFLTEQAWDIRGKITVFKENEEKEIDDIGLCNRILNAQRNGKPYAKEVVAIQEEKAINNLQNKAIESTPENKTVETNAPKNFKSRKKSRKHGGK